MITQSFLRAANISFGTVLCEISLSWQAGELVGIAGPNGVGKSTLLRVCAGQLTPDSGHITCHGQDIHKLPARERARFIAYVPQELPVKLPFSVTDFVATGRYVYQQGFRQQDTRRNVVIDDALSKLGLSDLRERPLHKLSGGELQRACLARGLSQETPILLLDEPLSSLDVRHQLEVLKLLKKLTDEGRLVICVLHDLELAARYCSRVILLHEGCVHSEGATKDVLTEAHLATVFKVRVQTFQDPFTQALRLSFPEGNEEGRSV